MERLTAWNNVRISSQGVSDWLTGSDCMMMNAFKWQNLLKEITSVCLQIMHEFYAEFFDCLLTSGTRSRAFPTRNFTCQWLFHTHTHTHTQPNKSFQTHKPRTLHLLARIIIIFQPWLSNVEMQGRKNVICTPLYECISEKGLNLKWWQERRLSQRHTFHIASSPSSSSAIIYPSADFW